MTIRLDSLVQPTRAENSKTRVVRLHGLLTILIALSLTGALMLGALGVATAQQLQLSTEAVNQMQALQAEKASRTPAQQKISSDLLYALKQQRHDPLLSRVPMLRSTVEIESDNTTLVDIQATVTDELLNQIRTLGGTVVNSFPQYGAIRASLPLNQLETLADSPDVRSIRSADKFMTNKVNTSEGDVAHKADVARTTFGVNGTGVKICALSDSVNSTYLTNLQASGDLPAVTVLPGQAGTGLSEGTAMLEIVYDLASGAQLFFATGNGGQAQFAQNIRDLRNVYHCDIIVDDGTYPSEAAFQDGIVAQAVNDVTASGALYFSSAANSGNLDHGTAGVWEGDYVGGIAFGAPYVDVQNFGGGNPFNRITRNSSVLNLMWSDPLGHSANDYDLFLVDPTGTNLVAASTNTQSGTQDPYEQITIISGDATNYLLLIARKIGAAPRFMRLNTNRGQLQIATSGQTFGHNAAQNAFTVAAVHTTSGTPFTGTESVEPYSSDGLRRIFYHPDGTPITPGNFLHTGGTVLQKPDITAADCVSTATPNAQSAFNPFCGTSAAAPHAAAMAGLMLSANHSVTPAQVRAILTSTTWDIEASGVDRDSGAGIVNAFRAVGGVIPPLCFLSNTGTDNQGHKFIQITAQDANNGLASIITTLSDNANVSIPAFTAGTKAPVIVTATKVTQSVVAHVALQVTNETGIVTNADPLFTIAIREKDKPSTETYTGISQEESKLEVTNSTPGVSNMFVYVNTKKLFIVKNLRDGEKRSVDISSAMVPGDENTVTLEALGKVGGSAIVVLSN